MTTSKLRLLVLHHKKRKNRSAGTAGVKQLPEFMLADLWSAKV